MTSSPRSNTSGARAALAGFDYQVDVSVFAALRMLLVEKSASRVVLEPANDEDLEADIMDAAAGRVETNAVSNGKRLIVQVKFASGEPWSDAALASLLKHGTRRRPASEHLNDPDARYLLVTNAALKGAARELGVEGFTEKPTLSLPRDVKKAVPKGSEGRLGVWAGLTTTLLDHELKFILCDILKVARGRWKTCRDKLRAEAKDRMSGETPGVWVKADLIHTIRSFGGTFASTPELEVFVPPSNFDHMLALFRKKNAIVIRGPSGTGKTIAALALCERAQGVGAGVDLVRLDQFDDPSNARILKDAGPRLYYVEDPWGSYDLQSGSGSWTDQLPRLLRMARPDYQFVVTSRTDILREAKGLEALKEWSVELDGACYENGELGHIYDRLMDLLRPDIQPLALEFRKDALEDLSTPLELKLFFSALEKGPSRREPTPALYSRIMAVAHRDAVSEVVVKYLASTTSTGQAAALWALLTSRGRLSREQLVEIHRRLRRSSNPMKGLDRIVDRLVSTHHLSQPSHTVSFSHPSVREGFEKFIREDWLASEDAIVDLVASLTTITGSMKPWAMQTAAQVVDVTTRFDVGFPTSAEQFDASSREAIDAWLETALLDPGSEFSVLLNLAADVGTISSNLSEVARWFLRGFKRGGAWFDDDWSPPDYNNDWYARINKDDRVAPLVDRFIREFFVNDSHVHYGRDFASRLDKITTHTTKAFLDVTAKLVGSHRDDIVGAAARGASRDIEAYEALLDLAFDEFDTIKQGQPQRDEEWRRIVDGEVDRYLEDYASSVNEDLGAAAGIVVEEYVKL